ncbi:MAG: hypothetical protein FJ011_03550 [Chloroflexi bacterium]|nr:hypothetical protein [Chloroflexota bacterium]
MRPQPFLKKYLHDLAETARRGDAREESFYPALSGPLAGVATAIGREADHVTALGRTIVIRKEIDALYGTAKASALAELIQDR